MKLLRRPFAAPSARSALPAVGLLLKFGSDANAVVKEYRAALAPTAAHPARRDGRVLIFFAQISFLPEKPLLIRNILWYNIT